MELLVSLLVELVLLVLLALTLTLVLLLLPLLLLPTPQQRLLLLLPPSRRSTEAWGITVRWRGRTADSLRRRRRELAPKDVVVVRKLSPRREAVLLHRRARGAHPGWLLRRQRRCR